MSLPVTRGDSCWAVLSSWADSVGNIYGGYKRHTLLSGVIIIYFICRKQATVHILAVAEEVTGAIIAMINNSATRCPVPISSKCVAIICDTKV